MSLDLSGLDEHTLFEEVLKLTPAERSAAKEMMLAESARGDDVQAVCDFAELVFGLVPADHHRAWIREILDNKRVVVVAPPESAKTTIISIVMMAWWIGKHPETTNLIVSAGEDLAIKIARTVAVTIEKNHKWLLVFPTVRPEPGGMWSRDGYDCYDTELARSGEWALRTASKKDPTLSSGGVGSSAVNGKRVTGLLLGDDLHDRESKRSDAVCLNTVGFVTDTFIPRATEDAHICIIQTRWNPKDVVGYLSGKTLFKIFVHPALNEKGDSYWADQWPLERLAERRETVGEVDFQLVYLCDPKAAQGRTLKRDWLHPFPYIYIKGEFERFIGVDFAQRVQELTGGKTRLPDEYALAVIVNTNPVLVVEDGFADRVTMGDAEEVFFQWAAMKNPVRSAVETNKEGVDYFSNLLKRMNTRGGQRYVVIPVPTTRNKATRMNEMAPYFQFGSMKINSEQNPFVEKFINEWVGFGTPGIQDNTLDAVYMAWKITNYLIPHDTPKTEAAKEFARRQAERHPMRVIDKVYS